MGCPRERAAVANVFIASLFLLAGQAGGGHSRGAAAVASADDDDPCSEEVVEVFQGSAGSLPNGIPSYSVTITNTCLDCTVCDVHVSCGEFASTEVVDPSDFRRLSYGDCLVRNGGPIGPGETISFQYSNSFVYKMDVAAVSCVDV
ncbi:TPD1 protein homolog 1B [Zea mays]|uniref:TPD1 protein homolog 1B n=1 Tax=Zea mays TaxID=4577 RepID=UPI0004DEC315|nr:TPD1 protein homolog 1B [Zea mays]|eukprot:XP_008675824.1 TPD1 protein homolog 1B [Zea mays]